MCVREGGEGGERDHHHWKFDMLQQMNIFVNSVVLFVDHNVIILTGKLPDLSRFYSFEQITDISQFHFSLLCTIEVAS